MSSWLSTAAAAPRGTGGGLCEPGARTVARESATLSINPSLVGGRRCKIGLKAQTVGIHAGLGAGCQCQDGSAAAGRRCPRGEHEERSSGSNRPEGGVAEGGDRLAPHSSIRRLRHALRRRRAVQGAGAVGATRVRPQCGRHKALGTPDLGCCESRRIRPAPLLPIHVSTNVFCHAGGRLEHRQFTRWGLSPLPTAACLLLAADPCLCCLVLFLFTGPASPAPRRCTHQRRTKSS